MKSTFYVMMLSLIFGTSSFGATLTAPVCDDRQAEDLAEEAYHHINVDGGNQIDYVKLVDSESAAVGSYSYEVRICQTYGSAKCGSPTHFGKTYHVEYSPTHYGDYIKNRRCLKSIVVVGD